MAKSASLIVIVAVLLINICSAENEYCVAPTATSCSSCPRNSTHCATLSEYGQEAELYFTSNTTMVFLPGQHTLDLNITVTNVTRLTMRRNLSADNVAMIVCNGSVGLSFSSMVEFKMYLLQFRSCSREYGNPPASNYALLLQSTQYAKLVNCSFYGNIGTAIVVNNSTNISVWNSEFAHNHCQSKSCIGGGGITVLNSTLTFTGNVTFLENSATFYGPMSGGGAIYTANHSILSFNGTNNFISNTADYGSRGGAIYATNNTVLVFNGSNNFINNSADYGSGGGGAIFASSNSIINFTGTTNFISNTADYYAGVNGDGDGGGAIYVSDNTVLSFRGNNNFIRNSASYGSSSGGGAICASKNAIVRFNGTNNFTSNSAYYSGDGGGAIYASNCTSLSFSGTNIFLNNSADHGGSGGAIYASDNIALSFNGTNSFLNNSAEYGDYSGGGGAIYVSDNIALSFNGTSSFVDNSANYGRVGGGALYISDIVVFSSIGTSIFISNTAQYCTGGGGGAIYTSRKTVLRFYGTNNFTSNSADYGGGYGGAVFATNNATLSFNGSSCFASNSANSPDSGGGAIYAVENAVLTFLGIINFTSNKAGNGGGGALLTSENTVVSFSGSNNFISNSVLVGTGGAISTPGNAMLSFSGINNFIRNLAGACGAIYTYDSVLSFNGTNNFIGNSAGINFGGDGGAICTSYNTILKFSGINNFINNSADNEANADGGAIYASNSAVLSFNGTNNFISNSADNAETYGDGGAIFASYSTVLSFNGTTAFLNNSATDRGGAVCLDTNSTLAFNGTITFINNGHIVGNTNTLNSETTYGGGVCIGLQSTFSILPNTTVYWENNHARLGGAIYVIDASPLSYCTAVIPYVPKEQCFLQVPGQNLSNIDAQLIFKNNSADAAGSVLYGGIIDNCKLTGLDSKSSGEVFDMIVRIEDDNSPSYISSESLLICPCKDKLPDCSESQYGVLVTVHPGETFQVSVVAAGQRDGTVPDNVISSTQAELLPSQYLQQAGKTCTELNYTVFSLSQQVKILLQAESNPCSIPSETIAFDITVDLNQTCPPGFSFSESAKACVCEPRLAEYTGTHQCNITNGVGKIKRMSSQRFWIGYNDQSQELILHPYCPFDYCVNNTVAFSLNNTDLQCAHNRSGLLCGECENNYSLTLGTHHCKRCTNSHLFLLIPFALMGVALVFFLLVCKLTVATGTISGLVFYANIVGVNRTIFLPVESTHPFSVFIAWLNLDFGIETCLYNGLDAYSKTWLQFVFPVYIWVIVGLIVFLSHYSQVFAKLLGSNPVSVLATLILLSYTKIVRTLITAIFITYLEYPTYNRGVWLYDANIEYLTGKHIPLFLMAVLVFLFLFLPYTLLLLFGQWLQTISDRRLFSWVNSTRLKSFMDAYNAPYKANHRYWPGLLLILRFFLLLVFALNLQQDPSINLLAILVGAGILHLWAWVTGGVYRNWCLDALEGSFVLNLIILVGATCYVKLTERNQLAVGYTSVSIALVTFIGILAFHIFQQLRHTKLWKKMPKLNMKFNTPNVNNSSMVGDAHFNQLREPLLEDQPQPNYGAV